VSFKNRFIILLSSLSLSFSIFWGNKNREREREGGGERVEFESRWENTEETKVFGEEGAHAQKTIFSPMNRFGAGEIM